MTIHTRAIASAIVLALFAGSAIAHEGHDDAPGTEHAAAGVSLLVRVSAEAREKREAAEAEGIGSEDVLKQVFDTVPVP